MRIGVIDIGTNSVRLLVAKQESGIKVEGSYLITTRLGQGLAATGVLSDEAVKRTVEALYKFKEITIQKSLPEVVLIATSAVREATNKAEFLQMVYRELGWEIRVISGEEEASLGYLGVTKGLPKVPENPLVIDIGGGSTEMIWESEGKINYTSSLAGAVRMTEQNSSREDIVKVLAPVLARVKESRCGEAVGIGGTATTLAAIDLELEQYRPDLVHGHALSVQRIGEISRHLSFLDLEARKRVRGLQPARADIILAGISIMEVILKELGVPQITVSESDIMYGEAFSYLK